MTLQELRAAAEKAIQEKRLDDARAYMEQIKALKDLDSLALSAAESGEVDALKAKVAELETFKMKVENEDAINDKKAGTVVVTQDETDKKAARPWKSLGEQLLAIYHAYTMPHMMDDRLKAQKAVLGHNEGQASDGGFLVQTDFVNEIFKIAHAMAALASRARRIGIGPNANGLKMNALAETSRATGSRWGGVRGYWLAEGAAKTASQIEFRQMELELKKLAVLMYATDELLQDTTALGNVMQQAASEELAFLLDDSIINGTGAGQPLGILNSAALISVAKETGQAADTIVTQNIFKMWNRLHAGSRANAIWTINQDVEVQLWSLDFPVGTGGHPVYLPPGGMATTPLSSLMGRPVIPTEFNATVGDLGDIMLFDPTQYLIIDKGGIQAASSIHVQFLTDQTAFRWVYRVDGQPLWNSALTPFKGTQTQSPYIALAARA